VDGSIVGVAGSIVGVAAGVFVSDGTGARFGVGVLAGIAGIAGACAGLGVVV